MGKQEAIEEILAISDLFLLPSENESFGLAALEAMACQVPVISSNAGGIPEVNVDGYTGYMCNVGDVEGMAARTIELLSDPVKLEKFKKQAFDRSTDFDIRQILPLYESFYEEVINKFTREA